VARLPRVAAGVFLATILASCPATAQESDRPDGGSSDAAESATATAPPRIFGVLPNYSTVERDVRAQAFSTSDMLRASARNSFDPYVFPFIGVSVALGQGGASRFADRYATTFADNAVGNFMTSAIFPAILGQDPRYYQRGTGSVAGRAGYALTRTIVTRSSAGRRQFNYSEIAGNFTAAAISNGYYGTPCPTS
jgi:hypothetical protein